MVADREEGTADAGRTRHTRGLVLIKAVRTARVIDLGKVDCPPLPLRTLRAELFTKYFLPAAVFFTARGPASQVGALAPRRLAAACRLQI